MATHGTLGFKVLVIKGWKAIYTLSETAGPRYYLECTGILAELMLIECGVVSIINQYFPWLQGNLRKKTIRGSIHGETEKPFEGRAGEA